MKETHFDYLKNFWNTKDNPLHFHKDEYWFERYFEEIKLLFFTKGERLLDIGCGSGELLKYEAINYNTVVGVDYSTTMLSKAKKKVEQYSLDNKVQLYEGSTKEILKFKTAEGYDHILLSGVLQYLNLEEINIFMRDAKELLSSNGVLLITNIPDYNLKTMHDIGIFHWQKDEKFNFSKTLKSILRAQYHEIKFKKNNLEKKKTMGNWYTRGEIKEIAKKNGFKVEVFNSLYEPYGYKFHVRLTLN